MIHKNIFLMSLLHFLNYVAPVILLPLIANLYGVFNYGMYGLALLYGSYVGLFVEFGFNHHGVREYISLSCTHDRISLFFRIFMGKILIVFLIVTALTVFYLAGFLKITIEYLAPAAFSFIIQGLTPNWYHQANENFFTIFFATLVGKLIYFFIALYIILLEAPLSYIIWGLMLGNFVSFMISMARSGLSLSVMKCYLLDTKYHILSLLKSAMPFFFVTVTPHLYSSLVIIHASQYMSLQKIGLILAAERIFFVLKQVTAPFLQVVYPAFQDAKRRNDINRVKSLKRLVFLAFFVVLFLSAVVAFVADWIIINFYGDDFLGAGMALSVFVICTPFIILTNYFGVQVLFYYGLEKITASVMLFVGIFIQIGVFFSITSHSSIAMVAGLVAAGEIAVSLIVIFLTVRLTSRYSKL